MNGRRYIRKINLKQVSSLQLGQVGFQFVPEASLRKRLLVAGRRTVRIKTTVAAVNHNLIQQQLISGEEIVHPLTGRSGGNVHGRVLLTLLFLQHAVIARRRGEQNAQQRQQDGQRHTPGQERAAASFFHVRSSVFWSRYCWGVMPVCRLNTSMKYALFR